MTIYNLSTSMAFQSKLPTKAILSSSSMSLSREYSSIKGSVITGGVKISDESEEWVGKKMVTGRMVKDNAVDLVVYISEFPYIGTGAVEVNGRCSKVKKAGHPSILLFGMIQR